MNKKPGLLFSVCVLAIIILAASFDLHIGGVSDTVHLKHGVNPGDVLYVCPVESGVFDSFSNSLRMFSKQISLFFTFGFIVLLFSWGWALYQNLLKDKFNADVYKNPWSLTKALFWAGVVITVLIATPNHFRTVSIHNKGHTYNYVLCEDNSAGARAVNERIVTAH